MAVQVPIPAKHGRVVGRFVVASGDGSDTDLLPDYNPVTGRITFVPNASAIRVVGAEPRPVTVLPAPIECGIDADGDLCYPPPGVGVTTNKFVHLIATDDEELNPSGWTYTVNFELAANGNLIHYAAFDVEVPANGVIDLTVAAPVATSSGIQITMGEKGETGLPGTIALIKGVVADEASLPTATSVEGDAYVLENGDLYSFIGGVFVKVTNIVGKSAYQSWLDMGYVGTEADFVDSLIGTDGRDGVDGVDGTDGTNGVDGKSAYQIWLEDGHAGTVADFFKSFNGKSAYQSWLNTGHAGTEQNFIDAITGTDGADGRDVYQVWLSNGNTGTEQDFLNSLEGRDVYRVWLDAGNAGTEQDFLAQLNGTDGTDGRDVYQVWLSNGNTGTEQDFLAAINGTDGKSAYESWLEAGNAGTEADFADYMRGTNGTNGTNGTDGKSAYQSWLDLGNTGTEADFVASLNGADGTVGSNGKSAYQSWLDQGNVGTEADFVASTQAVDGIDGDDGLDGESAYATAVANGFVGTEVEWLASLEGADGKSAYQLWLEEVGNAGKTYEEYKLSNKGDKGDSGSSTLAGLTDVSDVVPADNQVLVFDTATSSWGPENAPMTKVTVSSIDMLPAGSEPTSWAEVEGTNTRLHLGIPNGGEAFTVGSLGSTDPVVDSVETYSSQTTTLSIGKLSRILGLTFFAVAAGTYQLFIDGSQVGTDITAVDQSDAMFTFQLDIQPGDHEVKIVAADGPKPFRYVETPYSIGMYSGGFSGSMLGFAEKPGDYTPPMQLLVAKFGSIGLLSDVFLPSNTTDISGQVLTYDGTTGWVASALPIEATTNWWEFTMPLPDGSGLVDTYRVRRTGTIVEWVMTTSVSNWQSYVVNSITASPGLTPNGRFNAHTFTATQINPTASDDTTNPVFRRNFAVVIGTDDLDPTKLNIKRMKDDYQPGSTDYSSTQFEATCWYQTSDPMPPVWQFPIDIANRWFPPQPTP